MLQELKSDGVAMLCQPWFYSSLNGLMLFQVMRGGIESVWVFGLQPWTNHPEDPHPRPFRSERTDDERVESIALPANRRNGYVVQFSFLGSNVSPFFQILRAIAEIFRASVSRAISLRMPFFSNP